MSLNYRGFWQTAVAIASVIAGSVQANDDAGELRHIHGQLDAVMAIAENNIVVSMIIPAYNLFGFEHRVSTDDEKKIFSQVQELLNTPSVLFTFEGALCRSVNIELDYSAIPSHEALLSKSVPHEQANIHARYDFKCNSTSTLSHIYFPIIDVLPMMNQVHLHWISDEGEGHTDITSGAMGIALKSLREKQ